MKEIKKPEKKDIKDNFTDDCYCKSCRLSETFCQCEGFNKGIKVYEAYHNHKMKNRISKKEIEKILRDKISCSYHHRIEIKETAQELHKRGV